jgi:hypothetical protein
MGSHGIDWDITVYQHGKCFIFVKYKTLVKVCNLEIVWNTRPSGIHTLSLCCCSWKCGPHTKSAMRHWHVHAYRTTNILHCTKYITYLSVDLYTALSIDEILWIIINKRRLQLRRDDLSGIYMLYNVATSYKDIIHTYYLLIVMLKLGRSLFELLLHEPSSPNSSSLLHR